MAKNILFHVNRSMLLKHQRNVFTLKSEGTIPGLAVSASMWVEYDGFLWVELTTSGKDVTGTARIEVRMACRQNNLISNF